MEVSVINTLDTDKCTGCGTCTKTCGLDVFRLETEQPVLSPCSAECPAGTDMRSYNYLMQLGRLDEAAQKLLERNPFPAITGRVCPHTCESVCSRCRVDGAVNINALEQYLGDRSLDTTPAAGLVRHVHRIAVAGSGPAGLSCAWFLARAGYRVKVFEARPKPGGMLRYAIPAYRLPEEVLDRQIRQLERLGVEFQCSTTVGEGCDCSLNDLAALGYKAVLLAPGAGKSRRAGIEGEELPGVTHALDFLEQVRTQRLTSLAGDVIVIGGGAVATDAAVTARRLGAARVDLYCLEQREDMPAFAEDIEEAERVGTRLHPGFGPVRIEEAEGMLQLTLRRCLAVFDEARRFAPVFEDTECVHAKASTIIFAIGQQADLAPFAGTVACERGRIAANPATLQTSYWNIFAAGDAQSGPATVIKAITAGREAALSIDRLMTGGHMGAERGEKREVAGRLPGEGVMLSPRMERRRCEGEAPAELRQGFDDIDALHESLRCLTCGAKARIAYRDDCMTCFFCELRCPEQAIDVHPFKERLPCTLERNFGGF